VLETDESGHLADFRPPRPEITLRTNSGPPVAGGRQSLPPTAVRPLGRQSRWGPTATVPPAAHGRLDVCAGQRPQRRRPGLDWRVPWREDNFRAGSSARSTGVVAGHRFGAAVRDWLPPRAQSAGRDADPTSGRCSSCPGHRTRGDDGRQLPSCPRPDCRSDREAHRLCPAGAWVPALSMERQKWGSALTWRSPNAARAFSEDCGFGRPALAARPRSRPPIPQVHN
jgi:hypothetical protein